VALLLAFALIAGFATCLSPCALPVLPVALSAGATGGRRRPLGIATGLVLSFTFATVALVYVISALGLPNDILRTIAIVVLAVFGLLLVVPAASARIEAWLSRFMRAPQSAGRGGFVSGVPIGFSLGFLYAPCAGPILAGVITVSAAQTFTAGRLAVATAYALGSALALYAIMLGGRRLTRRLVARSARVQQAIGIVMLIVAGLVVANVGTRFQTAIASKLPAFLVSPADRLERSGAIKGALAEARGTDTAASRGEREATLGKRLPVLGTAPDFVDNQRWFNTPGDRPLTIRGLRGRVVLVDFWTYTCINCIRTFPHLKALDAKYRKDGLTIVGVHSPEFPFEKNPSNVAGSIRQNGLRYPVAQDNDLATWSAYRNQFWPADYLIDAEGRIRYVHFGEGDYEQNEKAVRSLLAEGGVTRLGGLTRPSIQRASANVQTPETYLGAARADGFVNGPVRAGTHSFKAGDVALPPNSLAYGGNWRITAESAVAGRRAEIRLDFIARRVYLVLGSPGRGRRLGVLLAGRPIPDRLAGADVHGGVATIKGQRLYRLVDLPRAERRTLTLRPEAGIAGYAFTFG
jgi:cytochrome c biogenesis protein CcdA/thiol-disulfide isomerase/thioredoxin